MGSKAVKPPPPPAPIAAPDSKDEFIDEARRKERNRARLAHGRRGTLLTGESALGAPETARKTLLG